MSEESLEETEQKAFGASLSYLCNFPWIYNDFKIERLNTCANQLCGLLYSRCDYSTATHAKQASGACLNALLLKNCFKDKKE